MSLGIPEEGGDPYVVHAPGTCKACDLWRNTPCDRTSGPEGGST